MPDSVRTRLASSITLFGHCVAGVNHVYAEAERPHDPPVEHVTDGDPPDETDVTTQTLTDTADTSGTTTTTSTTTTAQSPRALSRECKHLRAQR